MQMEVLIGIIIGIIVISFVIYGFSTQWKFFDSKICAFANCYTNVEAVQNSCELMCIEKDLNFCTKEITLKLNENEKIISNCSDLSKKTITGVNIKPCYSLSCE